MDPDPRIVAALMMRQQADPRFGRGVQLNGQPPNSIAAAMMGPAQGPGAGYPLDERGQPVVSPRDVTPGQPQPGRGAVSQYVHGVGSDIADLARSPDQWLDALGTAAGPAGEAGIGMAAGAANVGSRLLNARILRSLTEGGAAKNATEDSAILGRRLQEANKPVQDAKDWAQLPPHVIQKELGLRDPKTGRFTSFPGDVNAAREAGKQRLQTEQKAAEKYPTTYDENGEWTPPPGWSDLIDKID